MKVQPSTGVSLLIALVGVVLSTSLLIAGLLGELVFSVVLAITATCSLAVFHASRLREINLKEMKIVLDRIERVKAEIDSMYGSIDTLKREPMVTDQQWWDRLGASNGLTTSGSVMSYVSGCMKRERERLAQIFIVGNSPEKTAAALVDHTKDDLVFKWEPGGVPLHNPPRSVEERRQANQAKHP